MTSRERVISAIEFKGPDRIPSRHAYLPAVFSRYPEVELLLRRFPSNFPGEDGLRPVVGREYKKDSWVDEMGLSLDGSSGWFHGPGDTTSTIRLEGLYKV